MTPDDLTPDTPSTLPAPPSDGWTDIGSAAVDVVDGGSGAVEDEAILPAPTGGGQSDGGPAGANLAEGDSSEFGTANLPIANLPGADHPSALAIGVGESSLQQDISQLIAQRDQLQQQVTETQTSLGRIIQDGLQELRERKQMLKLSIEQLERKQDRIRKEMRESFAGNSQDVAVRVQSFKDYLVGSLQDLVATAEQLNLPSAPTPTQGEPSQDKRDGKGREGQFKGQPKDKSKDGKPSIPRPQFAEQSFEEQARQIRKFLDRYRNAPDYYGPAWQLRRTFEPVHAERVSEWFFDQGGRGAVRTMGSRLQNILVASAVISVLNEFYGERLCALVLANSPERLGDWRRGFQECLGISRDDFGPNRGVMLSEAPEALAQRADRLLRDGDLPLIIFDETEEYVNVSLLQYPLWLAFAPDPLRRREEEMRPEGRQDRGGSLGGNFGANLGANLGDRMVERLGGVVDRFGLGDDRYPSDRYGNDRYPNDRNLGGRSEGRSGGRSQGGYDDYDDWIEPRQRPDRW